MTNHQPDQRQNSGVNRQRDAGFFLVGFGVALILAYVYMKLNGWG